MKEMMRRTLIMMICCALAVGCVLPTIATASNGTEESTYKTVRVGWYQSPMFQEGASDDAIKSGYCYDYLQKVADYTSWRYEYVYGNWEDLFFKLHQTKEIRTFGSMSIVGVGTKIK